MATNGSTRGVCYVYNIPFKIRQRLCMILDGGGAWKTLAGELGYTTDFVRWLELALMRPGGSPTDDLLSEWGHSNATVTSLFRYLHHMKHYRALSLLKELVPKEMSDDIELGNVTSEVKDVRLPPNINEVNAYSEQKHTSELPAPEPPHFPVQDHENFLPKTEACEHIASGTSRAMSYMDNSIYTNSLEFVPPEKKSVKSVTQKQAVESLDRSFTNGKGDLTTSHVRPDKLASTDEAHSELKAVSQNAALLNTQHFSHNEIAQATYGFHDNTVLGKGGFGTVYKGILKNTVFAIKRLKNKPDVKLQKKQHMTEIKALLRYRHDNIIQLCGYSMDGPQLCLVYQFMQNGSLENRLACKDGTKPLTWVLRHHILTGSARGIQYLHYLDKTPLIHGDIKSANILLDKHFVPKVADFGLAKEATGQNQSGQYTHVSHKDRNEKVFGSIAYLPKEFFDVFQFSIKTDTYSFGVVIYETCTGEQAQEEKREGGQLLKEYVDKLWSVENRSKFRQQLCDKKASDWPSLRWDALMKLGLQCTSIKKKDRPNMQKVLSCLENFEPDSQTAVSGAAPVSEDFTHLSYQSGTPGVNNYAVNDKLETLCNSDASLNDSDELQFAHRKLELDSTDESGSVTVSPECKLGCDSSTRIVTTGERKCDHDDRFCHTDGEDTMKLHSLMESLKLTSDSASPGEGDTLTSDSASPGGGDTLTSDSASPGGGDTLTSDSDEISRKLSKKRPQFLRNMFGGVGGSDSQLTDSVFSEGEQLTTESTDLYGLPSVDEKTGVTPPSLRSDKAWETSKA